MEIVGEQHRNGACQFQSILLIVLFRSLEENYRSGESTGCTDGYDGDQCLFYDFQIRKVSQKFLDDMFSRLWPAWERVSDQVLMADCNGFESLNSYWCKNTAHDLCYRNVIANFMRKEVCTSYQFLRFQFPN